MSANDQTLPPERGQPDPDCEDLTAPQDPSVVAASPGGDRTALQPPITVEPGSTGRLCPLGPVPPAPAEDPPTVPAATGLTGSAAVEDAPPLPGHVPLRKLGEGTYGQVWLYQEDNPARRRVAVKFLACRSNQQWLLLQGEVRQLALLDADPGIIGLRRVELDHQPPYYVMNFAEGGSLSQRLAQGALPAREAISLFRQIVRAMAFVHANGVRHCDLKPGNILLDKLGRPLLADFGQSHLETERSPGLGTFFYMAPEQADLANATPDPRWDVYALGALLYAMLTGQPPRGDPEARQRLGGIPRLSQRLQHYRDHVRTSPPPSLHRKVKGVDGPLADLIDRCLAVEPWQRPRDAGEVRDSLERWLRKKSQRPVLAFALVLPVLLLAAMGGFAHLATSDAVQQSEAALTEQLQESDQMAASLVAAVVTDELEDRSRVVGGVARNEEFVRAVADRDGHQIEALLRGYHDNRGSFDAWFVADADGNLLGHYPDGLAGHGPRNYAWRDWFHGKGSDRPEGQKLLPITRPHISQPYVGTIRPGKVLAISFPVYRPDDQQRLRPVAVVAARFPVGELSAWIRQVRVRDGHVVLLTDHYDCLLHPHTGEAGQGPPGRAVLRDCPLYHELVEGRQACKGCCHDPFDGREYLMSGAPLAPDLGGSDTCWGVVVQHQKQEALGPIAELERRLWVIGAVSLMGAVVATLALWAWLIWALRREEAGPPLGRRLGMMGTVSMTRAGAATLTLWARLIRALRREEAGTHG